MATTNLKEQTLGGVRVQSGTGTPDHTDPKGSLYVDKNTGDLYKNSINSEWASINYLTNVTIYFEESNITYTDSGSAFGFITGSTYNWTLLKNSGFTVNEGEITVDSGSEGVYECTFVLNLETNGSNPDRAEWEFGIAINGTVPDTTNGRYGNISIQDTAAAHKTCSVTLHYLSLNAGDTIGMVLRGYSASGDDVVVVDGRVSLRRRKS
jgi:hypothetical protein